MSDDPDFESDDVRVRSRALRSADEAGRSDEVLALCEQRLSDLRRAGAAGDEADVVATLVTRAIAQHSLGHRDEAADGYAAAAELARLTSADEVDVQAALAGTASLLFEAGDLDAALEAIDEALVSFPAPEDAEMRVRRQRMRRTKLDALLLHGRFDEALVLADATLADLTDTTVEAEQLMWAETLVNKAAALGAVERVEESLACLDAVIDRFGGADEPPVLRRRAAIALNNKAAMLGQAGDVEAAVALQERLVEQFGPVAIEALGEQVADITGPIPPHRRGQVAGARALQAQLLFWLERPREALALIDELIDALGDVEEDDDARLAEALDGCRELREVIRAELGDDE